MTELDAHPLLVTNTVAVWDVSCRGTCKHKSAEECVAATRLVFPYRGIYVRHVGRVDTVAEGNQILFFNEAEPYQVSHPIEGGDVSLSIGIDEATLLELAPADYLQSKDRALFNRSRMRIDGRAQLLSALVRHRLARGVTETLEAESLTLSLVSRVSIGIGSGPRIGIQKGPPCFAFRTTSVRPVGAGRGCGDGASAG
jgi:AraC family transcriptional regulator